MMTDVERVYNKLEELEVTISTHSDKSAAFQTEVMNILKGSFEGTEWRPGIAPLLREQIVRIDKLETHVEEATKRRLTWWHGFAFTFFGALVGKVMSTITFVR